MPTEVRTRSRIVSYFQGWAMLRINEEMGSVPVVIVLVRKNI